jgi:hypothetical protein
LIAQTNIQTSGTYFVAASALVVIDAYDGDGYCYDKLGSATNPSQYGGSNLAGYTQQASMTDSLFVSAGDSVQLWCYSEYGYGYSYVYNAGLTATLINQAYGPGKRPKGNRPRPPGPTSAK